MTVFEELGKAVDSFEKAWGTMPVKISVGQREMLRLKMQAKSLYKDPQGFNYISFRGVPVVGEAGNRIVLIGAVEERMQV